MTNKPIIILTAILLALSICMGQEKGIIEGRIVSAETSEPLVGANVFIENSTLGSASNSDGRFAISRVPAGSITLVVSLMGYKLQEHEIEVKSGESVWLEVSMEEDILQFNQVVVISSKKEQELLRVPVSVGVVSKQEIREKGIYSVQEAMNYLPGVTFVGNQVNIRNASGFMYGAGSRTVVLIDGIPINSSDTGEINWDLVPLVDVERIEVIKGAGSFLYGTNALGGAINIITRPPSEEGRLLIGVSAGIYDDPYYEDWKWTDRTLHFNRQDISYSRKFGKLAARFSLRRDENLGYMQNKYHHRFAGSAKLVYSFNPNSVLTVYGSLMRDRRGEFIMWKDQRNVLLAPDEEQAGNLIKLNQGYLYIIHRQVFSPRFSSKIRVSMNELLLGNQYDRPDDFFPAVGPGVELSATFIPTKTHTLTGGVEVKTDGAHIKQIGKHDAVTIAPYLQHEFRPIEPMTITSGIRYDLYKLDDSSFKANVSPRFGINYLVNPDWSIRASAGRGFRSPAIVERFLRLSISGFEVFPNPDLKSERAWSLEVGSRFNITKSWFGDIALFQNDYWDLIEPTIDITSNSIQFLNVSRPRIRGIEIETRFSWWANRLGLEANLILMDHRDLSNDKYLFYRPRRLARIIPSIRLGNFTFQAEYHYASRTDRVQVFPLDERVAMHLWKTKGSYRWSHFRVTAEIDNIFNYNYTTRERFLEPIRNMSLGLQTDF